MFQENSTFWAYIFNMHNILLLHFCANFQYTLDFGLVLRWPFLSSGNHTPGTPGRATGGVNSLSE